MILRNSSNKPIQIDAYTIISQLGHGGFGTVYHVRDKDSKEYALKLLHSAHNVKRVNEHFEILDILNTSSSFLKTYLSKRVSQNFYILSEYSKELNLEKTVQQELLSQEEAIKVVHDILDALEFFQKNNIIHGDIKAENILKKDERYYLIDYDIAIHKSFMNTVHIQGDDDFTAPEIFKGSYSHEVDIYALGCTLYYLLSGMHIYGFTNRYDYSQKMFGHLYSEPVKHERISSHMYYLIQKMTAKNPKKRPTIGEMRTILDMKAFNGGGDSIKIVEDTFECEYERYKYMAEDKIAFAQNIFGLIYEEGKDIKKDLEFAFECYSLASEQDLVKAHFNRALCYKYEKGCEQDYIKAMQYFMKATEHGHNRSFYEIADMYEKGLGLKANGDKAKLYYEKAALHGYKRAHNKLKKLFKK